MLSSVEDPDTLLSLIVSSHPTNCSPSPHLCLPPPFSLPPLLLPPSLFPPSSSPLPLPLLPPFPPELLFVLDAGGAVTVFDMAVNPATPTSSWGCPDTLGGWAGLGRLLLGEPRLQNNTLTMRGQGRTTADWYIYFNPINWEIFIIHHCLKCVDDT